MTDSTDRYKATDIAGEVPLVHDSGNEQPAVVLDGRFELLDVIGEGGMGRVHKAWHRLLERHVAVKMLHPYLVADERQLVQMRAEARIIAELQHDNIVAVHAFGTTSAGAPYVVMELIEGRSLSEVLEGQKPLPFATCVDILLQVAWALEFAHEHGIVHRDLKPSNIMIVNGDGKDRIKLVDFGIARRDVASTTITQVVGSPPYMSPEQCLGKRGNPLSDLYSLGCVAFEMIAGAPPFEGASPMETLRLHLVEPAPLLRSRRSDTPLAIQNMVAKLLAKEPELRYASAGALIADLVLIQDSLSGKGVEPLIAAPVAQTSGAAGSGGGRRVGWKAAFVATALALVGIAAWAVFKVKSPAPHGSKPPAAMTWAIADNRIEQLPKDRKQRGLTLINKLEVGIHGTDDLFSEFEKTLVSLEQPPRYGNQTLVEQHLKIGREYLVRNRFADALRHAKYAAAIEQRANAPLATRYVEAVVMQAQIAAKQGHLSESEAILRQAESILPPGHQKFGAPGFLPYTRIVAIRALNYLRAGEAEKAIPLIQLLIDHAPRGHEGEDNEMMLRALNLSGRYEEVVKNANRWLAEEPQWSPPSSRVLAINELVKAYLKLGQTDKAIETMVESLEHIRGHDRNWGTASQEGILILTAIYHDQGKYTAELELLQKAWDLEMENNIHEDFRFEILERMKEAARLAHDEAAFAPYAQIYEKLRREEQDLRRKGQTLRDAEWK